MSKFLPVANKQVLSAKGQDLQASPPAKGDLGRGVVMDMNQVAGKMGKLGNTKIFNKNKYKQRRQTLRGNMAEPEKRLWHILRNSQMDFKFRRQYGIESYIVDFYCPVLKLVIEVDGDSHFSENALNYDTIRDDFILSLDIIIIRLKNNDVMRNINGVHQYIKYQLDLRLAGQGKNNS